MALVGEASILVKAITTGVKKDIERGFGGAGPIGGRAGDEVGRSFARGFDKSAGKGGNFFKNFQAGMRSLRPEAEAVNTRIIELQKKFFTLSPIITSVVGALISLGGGLIALGGAVLGASASLVSFLNIMVSIKVATAVAKMGLSGVGKALQALNQKQANAAQTAKQVENAQRALAKAHEQAAEAMANADRRFERAQIALTKAIRAGREEIQQLGFDSEDAAIAEKRAAMQLEDARNALARVADLPPNSRARKEAELAFAEADLNLRRAKDRVGDLADEQNKIAAQKGQTDGEIAATEEVNEAIKDQIRTRRDNTRAIKDAQQALKDAQAGGPGNDPYKGLLKSQKDFVDFLMGEKPKYEELKRIVANGWIPTLQKQMDRVITAVFPTFRQGFKDITDALNIATVEVANAFTDRKNIENLQGLFKIISQVIKDLGPIIGNVFGIMLSIMNAVQPTAHDLLTSFGNATKEFDTFLKSAEGNKSMTDFFSGAGLAAEKLGTIFGNVFAGLMTLIKEMVKPGSAGQLLLDYFVQATQKFADLGKADGGESLNKTLMGMAENTIAVLKAFGALFGALKDLGSAPGIRELFESLEGEAPIVEEIVNKFSEMAPFLGPLVTELLKMINALTESESAGAFFTIITDALKVANDLLETPAMTQFLKMAGPIHATAIGLQAVGQGFQTVSDYFLGGISKISGTLGEIQKKGEYASAAFNGMKDAGKAFQETMDLQKHLAGMDGLSTSAGGLKGKFMDLKIGATGAFDSMKNSNNGFVKGLGQVSSFFMKNPILLAIMVIVGAIVTLYMTNKKFQEFVDKTMAPVLETLGETFDRIVVAIQPLIAAFQEIFSKLMGGGEGGGGLVAILELLVTMFASAAQALLPLIAGLVEMLVPALTIIVKWIGVVITIIMAVINTIVEFAKALFSGDWSKFGEMMGKIWGAVWDTIMKFVKDALKIVGGFFASAGKAIGDFFGGIGKFFTDVWNNVVKFFKGIVNNLIGLFESFINFVINGLNNFMRPLRDAINGILKGLGIGFQFSVIPNVKIPRLAKGGVVMPSDGGSIVNVAEAGRAERIEPLDPSGLSQRDRALIEMLSKKNNGGGNGQPITLNVYPSAGMDERDLAEKVSRQLQLMMRKGAVG
jgi:phage-related protein